MATYKTSDFRKGLKVQIDGEPWLMVEMNFRKPGKGNALYEVRLKNLIRGNTLSRVYKGGDSLEAADVEETEVQYLYKQPGGKGEDLFVFMDNANYEQYEVDKEKLDEGWKYLKEGMPCTMMLFNGLPVSVTPPSHVELKVEYCEPGARGDTATNVTKPVRLETGAEILAPLFINMGNVLKIDTRTGDYVERVSN